MRASTFALSAAPILLGVGSLAAGQNGIDSDIEEIVVSSTKLEKSLTDLTQSVTIISEDEITLKGYTDFTEIMRGQAGLEFKQAGGPGQFNYPKMRGFSSSAILVVVDGVKINQASSGSVDHLLGQIDPTSIERVEILRGPQAVLYGANSTAGVISITTKSGQRRDAGVQLEAGSLDWTRAALSFRDTVEAGEGDFAYSVNLSSIDSGNVHEHEFYEDQTIQTKLGYDLDRVGFGLSFWETDNRFGYAQLADAGRGATRETYWRFQTPDPNQSSGTLNRVAGAHLRHDISDTWSQRLQVGSLTNTYNISDLPDGFLGLETAPFDGFSHWSLGSTVYSRGDTIEIHDRASEVAAFYADENTQLDYNLIFNGDRFGALFGVESLDQNARQWGTYGTSDGDENVTSLYANAELDLSDRFILAFGVRSDDYDTWGDETTGSLGIVIDVGTSGSIFSNYGTSFTAPTLSQLLNPTYGTLDLSPQSGTTTELGYRTSLADARLNVEATLWHTELDNVIVYDATIVNPRAFYGYGQYANRDVQVTEGLEFTANYVLSDLVSVYGNYTYTDSNLRRGEGEPWTPTVQIAKNKGNLGIDVSNERFYLGANAYYADERLRWAGDIAMKPYWRVDLTGRMNFSDALSGYLRVENLLDEDIEEGLGYVQPGIYGILGIQYKMF
ncbi:MAG: TonB-dependent receptor [Rhodospirillaceae bacterium]|nr:TonB-dependent receptor [Rhodospirillaceae bacterium]MDE0000647.1 TonB-dependent receptor [Rhodospirillaceae bacterium]